MLILEILSVLLNILKEVIIILFNYFNLKRLLTMEIYFWNNLIIKLIGKFNATGWYEVESTENNYFSKCTC